MKVVIIGGVAGGATAAARIRRLDEQAEIVVFERSGFISYANCGLPYYIGGTIEDENDLSNVNIPVTIIKTPHTLTKFTRVLKGLKKNKIPIIPNKIPSTIKNFSKKSFITHHILKK